MKSAKLHLSKSNNFQFGNVRAGEISGCKDTDRNPMLIHSHTTMLLMLLTYMMLYILPADKVGVAFMKMVCCRNLNPLTLIKVHIDLEKPDFQTESIKSHGYIEPIFEFPCWM